MTTTEPVLGRAVTGTLDAADLDLWPKPATVRTVTIHTTELLALCPVTGAPDVYECRITYDPNNHIVESKALKMYLTRWRTERIGAEALTDAIATDLSNVLLCPVEVNTRQQIRGGLSIMTTANA